MRTKFKSNDMVYLENNPDEKMTVLYIQGNEIHCIDSKNRQVIFDATELIKVNPKLTYHHGEADVNLN